MKKLFFTVCIIAFLSLYFGFDPVANDNSAIAGGARCYRIFDLDLSEDDTVRTELPAWNGSGEIAFFLNITGYGKDGTAGAVKVYSEIQDSMWALKLTYDASTSDSIVSANGYKRCTIGMWPAIAANTITGNKAYGDKIWFNYYSKDDTSGHLTLDACVRKD